MQEQQDSAGINQARLALTGRADDWQMVGLPAAVIADLLGLHRGSSYRKLKEAERTIRVLAVQWPTQTGRWLTRMLAVCLEAAELDSAEQRLRRPPRQPGDRDGRVSSSGR